MSVGGGWVGVCIQETERERLIGFKKLIYTTMETEKSRPGKAKSEDRRRPKSSLKTVRQRENILSYSTQPH